MSEPFTFTLDGATVTVHADPKAPALGALREHLPLHGVKGGCSPQGLCGCCLVLLDGKPRLTCTLPTKSLAGKSVVTLDGIPEEDRVILADSFVRAGALQCGYCTPGIALSAWGLLQGEPAPGRDAITRALNLHTCRCTGYGSIVTAIEAAAAVRRGEGCPLPACDRPEGAAIVLGARPYVDDLSRPGMLHGAVVLAPSARGRIAAIDLEPARALGAVAVALREPGEVLVHAGEIVAAVAHADATVAQAAAEAVVVTVDAHDPPEPEILARGRRVDGDVAAALAECAHRVELTVEIAATDPVFLEPEAALAVPVRGEDGAERLVVYSQGHDAAAEARALAAVAGVPVEVRLVPSGGSYGGKEALTVAPAAAALARAAGRPVRVAASLEEGMRLHRRRPAAEVRVRAGCDGRGGGLVLDVAARFDGGADAWAPDRVVAQALGAVGYRATTAVEAAVVGSSGSATGPIRGAGAAAVCVAIEQALDRLAGEARVDRLVIRRRNAEGEAAAVIEAAAAAYGGEGTRGVGLARVDGSGGARVVLTVVEPGEIEVQCNVADLGQGRDEALMREVVAGSGVAADAFTIAWGSSDVVGAGALATAPVAEAARRAGEALARGGGVSAPAGARFVGEAGERAPAGWCVAIARLDAAGALAGVETFAAVGEGQDAFVAARVAEGCAHMGVGVALSEEVVEADGIPDGRFRVLGVLKPRVSPPLNGHTVGLPGGERDVSEPAFAATTAAVAAAVAAFEGAPRARLPMKDSAAARGVGVRVR